MLTTSIQPTNNRTNFYGLSNKLGKKICIDGKKDIVEILDKRGDKSAVIGELPACIFNCLPVNNREGAIKEILGVFSECAEEIRNFRPGVSAPREERLNRRPNAVVDKMRDVFVKYNVLKEPEKFDLVNLGAGEYKRAYKMEGITDPKNGDRICFKVFHKVDTTPEWHKYKCHGNYSEINISAYWRKNAGMNTQLNKVYTGDINNGYLLDRYVDIDVKEPSKIVDVYDNGVRNIDAVSADTGHNKLYGYSIDEGGSRVVNRVKNQSPTARYVLKHMKQTPEQYRIQEWFRILRQRRDLDDTQKKAGLALSIKHFPEDKQVNLIERCLKHNEPLVDQALGYALKYLHEDQSEKYFEILMKRNNPITQTVLLNEIPLLAKKPSIGKRYDDVNVPRGVVEPDIVAKYYDIAKDIVLPEAEEHLASYVHLLPKERIIPEAERLISRNSKQINDRLLHKIIYVGTDEFSFDNKMQIINSIEKHNTDPFIADKAQKTKIRVIRDSLED